MGRTLGLVATVCSLAIVGVLMMLSMSHNGPTAKSTKVAEAQATAAVDGLPAIAATTIKTMIADPRFPVFFLIPIPLAAEFLHPQLQ